MRKLSRALGFQRVNMEHCIGLQATERCMVCFGESSFFQKKKIGHLRIDTHADNHIMQHLILKNGFEQCGIIHIADGSERIAYEKVVSVAS